MLSAWEKSGGVSRLPHGADIASLPLRLFLGEGRAPGCPAFADFPFLYQRWRTGGRCCFDAGIHSCGVEYDQVPPAALLHSISAHANNTRRQGLPPSPNRATAKTGHRYSTTMMPRMIRQWPGKVQM